MNVSRLNIQKMIAVTAMAMAIPMSAYAGHHEEGGKKQHSEMRHHYKHGGMGFLKQLDLTEAQQAQVKEIMSKQRTEMKTAMSERRTHRDEMKSIVEQDTFDSAKAEQQLLAEQTSTLQQQLAQLTETEFSNLKQAQLLELQRAPANLEEEFDSFSRDWLRNRLDFSDKQLLVAAIEALTLAQLQQFYNQAALADNTAALQVVLQGQGQAQSNDSLPGFKLVDDVAVHIGQSLGLRCTLEA